jgi:hypothetical protein
LLGREPDVRDPGKQEYEDPQYFGVLSTVAVRPLSGTRPDIRVNGVTARTPGPATTATTPN